MQVICYLYAYISGIKICTNEVIIISLRRFVIQFRFFFLFKAFCHSALFISCWSLFLFYFRICSYCFCIFNTFLVLCFILIIFVFFLIIFVLFLIIFVLFKTSFVCYAFCFIHLFYRFVFLNISFLAINIFSKFLTYFFLS